MRNRLSKQRVARGFARDSRILRDSRGSLDSRDSPRQDSRRQDSYFEDSPRENFPLAPSKQSLAFIAVMSEILVGAVLGIAISGGFFLSFIALSGSLIFSLVLFCVILVVALFFAFLCKCIFFSVLLHRREVELLEGILGRKDSK